MQIFEAHSLNEKYLLNEGDSLFKLRKYVDAKKIYENLYYEKNYFSDAMLLKLSFIEEGIGNYEKALIYLSKHYYQTHNKETSTKIKSIATAIWTDDVKTAYKKYVEDTRPPS